MILNFVYTWVSLLINSANVAKMVNRLLFTEFDDRVVYVRPFPLLPQIISMFVIVGAKQHYCCNFFFFHIFYLMQEIFEARLYEWYIFYSYES